LNTGVSRKSSAGNVTVSDSAGRLAMLDETVAGDLACQTPVNKRPHSFTRRKNTIPGLAPKGGVIDASLTAGVCLGWTPPS
jgi:hypothetical protein